MVKGMLYIFKQLIQFFVDFQTVRADSGVCDVGSKMRGQCALEGAIIKLVSMFFKNAVKTQCDQCFSRCTINL